MQTAEETRLNCWPLRKQSEIQLLIGLLFSKCWLQRKHFGCAFVIGWFWSEMLTAEWKKFLFFIPVLWHLSTEFNNFPLLLIFFCWQEDDIQWRKAETSFQLTGKKVRWLIRAYAWRRYFCRRLARDLKVLKILFCTRLCGFVPSSISSGSVRC